MLQKRSLLSSRLQHVKKFSQYEQTRNDVLNEPEFTS